MTNVVPFPGEGPPSDGGGPEDPMVSERVEKLEQKMDSVDRKLSSIETILAEIRGQLSQLPKATDHAGVKGDLGELKGRIAGLPNTWQLLTMVVGTWGAGAAIVFAIMRFLPK